MEFIRRTTPGLPGVLLLGFLTLLGACQDPGSPKPQGPGIIQVDLISPYGAEGSAVFELRTGASLGTVTGYGGDVYYEHDPTLGTSKVIVIMEVPGQLGFKVQTGDVGEIPSVTLLQVADGDDVLRESLTGYEIDITPLAERGS